VALPQGTMLDGIGGSDLEVTTQSESARRLTRQGFALIHCFWFNEAVRSFRDATVEDPGCASAWLGLNIALTLPWHRPQPHQAEADFAIRRAVALSGEVSDLEQSLIAAFRLRSLGKEDRDSDFERALEAAIERHPQANEPRLLLSAIRVQLCLADGYDELGDLVGEMKKVLGHIGPVLERDPHNPGALHYHIHALEGTNPAAALESANRLGPAAPGSSHLVHMPGHIYNRLGLYQKAHEAFAASKALDEAYFDRIPGATRNTNWNYGHNLDYMIFNLAEMGRLREGEEIAKLNPFSLGKLRWRSAQWEQLAAPARQAAQEGRPISAPGALFFAGMASVAEANLDAAAEYASRLEDEAAKRSDTGRGRALTNNRVVMTQALELRGALLSTEGRHEEAVEKLREAVRVYDRIAYEEPPYYIRPPHETLAEALLRAGRPDEAIDVCKQALENRPASGWLLYFIGLAHERAGRQQEARQAYETFLQAWPDADPGLPQVVAARAHLEGQRQSGSAR
jgi:tetratricopeptide (TPR) repeat protein